MRPTPRLFLGLLIIVTVLLGADPQPIVQPTKAESEAAIAMRRINATYTSSTSTISISRRAVSWFGRVDPTANYADIRAIYNDESLWVSLNIFDRMLWYTSSPTPGTLQDWDAVTLYFSTEGNAGSTPTAGSHKFVAQLRNGQPPANYQSAYRGSGGVWAAAATPFVTTAGWRGNGLNDQTDDRGWQVTYEIPFASLGLSSAPQDGSTWGLAVVVHDRDDAPGTPIADQSWPETISDTQPSTWGQLGFGLPVFNPPFAATEGVTTIRHGLNGATVVDGHVGGHTDCGQPYAPDYFSGWGSANLAGSNQVNIQNQWDVADWPCYSKYFVTFPINSIPVGKVIIEATLIMHLFGGSDPTQAPPSLLQVLTLADEWDEGTLNWNNAPLASENVAGTWVDPLLTFPGWPGVPVEWNVGRAVTQAYAADEPVRLAVYSADGAYHTGKYFSSSDTGEWNAVARPTLVIRWGHPLEVVSTSYLPVLVR
jgi:hypothetical protein